MEPLSKKERNRVDLATAFNHESYMRGTVLCYQGRAGSRAPDLRSRPAPIKPERIVSIVCGATREICDESESYETTRISLVSR